MNNHRKYLFMRVVIVSGVILILFASCVAPGKSDQEIAAEKTLAAIYAQETAQAAESDETPLEPVAEPTQETEPEPEWIEPGEVPEPERTLADSNSSYSADEHKATQGDNFLDGLFERPFTSEVMDYRPDLDITEVDFAAGEGFFYFTIRLYGMNPQGGGLKGSYGIEFDRNLTGRGDLLVWVTDPAYEWSGEEVTIYGDKNRDVGGLKPIVAEPGFDGSGYDMTIEMDEMKNAFARIDPERRWQCSADRCQFCFVRNT